MKHRTFVGLHVPKCAGTSLLDQVRSSLPPDRIFQNTSIIQNYQEQRQDFLHIAAKKRLRFVWGHSIHEEMLKFFGTQTVLITGLREPMDRFNSELNYMVRLAQDQKRSPPDLDRHIRNAENPICKFLVKRFPRIAGDLGTLADQAMNVINACHYVYFSETYESTAGAIFKAMGINPKPIKSNVANTKSGYANNVDLAQHKFDLEMYKRAQERFANISPCEAFSSTNPVLAKFTENSVNKQLLRDFLWESSFHEYRNWNALQPILEQRKQQIEELRSEIDYYEEKLRTTAGGSLLIA